MPRPKKVTTTTSSSISNNDILKKEREAYIASLKKQGMLGDVNKKVDFISTGSWVINRLIGDGSSKNNPGGIPRGYFTEICGEESSGKTTLALHIVKQALMNNEFVIYADYEHSLRIQSFYLKNLLGEYANSDKFIHIVPESLEEGVKSIGDGLIKLRPALIVIDSVAAMLPRETIEDDADSVVSIGKHAKLVGSFINYLSKKLQKYNTAVLLINQFRSNIKQSPYDIGPAQITTGGKALQYFISLKIRLKKTSNNKEITDTNIITGVPEKKRYSQEIKVVIEKNKIDMPWLSGPIYIIYGQGIDNVLSLISLGVNLKVIKKNGGYYTWDDDKHGFNINGEYALREYLLKNTDTLDALQSKLIVQRDVEEIKNRIIELEQLESLDEEQKAQLEELKKLNNEFKDDSEKKVEIDDKLVNDTLTDDQLKDLEEFEKEIQDINND